VDECKPLIDDLTRDVQQWAALDPATNNLEGSPPAPTRSPPPFGLLEDTGQGGD